MYLWTFYSELTCPVLKASHFGVCMDKQVLIQQSKHICLPMGTVTVPLCYVQNVG